MTIYQDYLRENILKQPGLAAWWPLDDASGASSARVLHPGQSAGRNIVLDSDFATDTIWSKGTGWTIGSGVATHAAGTGSNLSQSIPMIGGRAYTMVFTVSAMTAGTIQLAMGGTAGTSRSANGTYTETIIAGTASTNLTFTASSTFDGSVDNVSVTELNIPPNGCMYNNPTVIADGDMEAAGTGSWTAGNSATLSKQAGTPYEGSQCLRVARNGVSTPYAGQTALVVGQVYCAYGYARSDGSAVPVIYTNGTATTLVTMTVSTSFMAFYFVFVATATDINFGTSTNTGTQYVEYDSVVVALDQSIRSGELAQDGNMELSGVTYWAGSQATISKQTATPHSGTNCLRVTATAGSGARAPQAIAGGLNAVKVGPALLGKTYRVTGWCRGDGTQTPKVSITGSFQTVGTSSTSWQQFDIVGVHSTNLIVFGFNVTNPAGTEYIEFDDISITEVSPLVGLPLNSMVQQSPAFGHLLNAYNFTGTALVNIYSAQLNSILPINEGTLTVWAQVSAASVWTDATVRDIVLIDNNTGTDFINIRKTASNNNLLLRYSATSVVSSVSLTLGFIGWTMFTLTWSKSANQFKGYMNGVQAGTTQTGLGQWAQNLASNVCAIGATSTAGANPWSGKINDVRLYNRVLSAPEILAFYRKYLPQFQTRTT